MYQYKWKPNKQQKEAFKLKLIDQDKKLKEIEEKYNQLISVAYWNKNKSSLYLFLKNDEKYRISTHHLPSNKWEFREFGIGEKYRNCSFVQKEIITNSRDNIINKAIQILDQQISK